MILENYDAIIYDMDGVLTDSEPIWKIAMEEVFASVGCTLTRNDFQRTVGLRIDEVVCYWYAVAPWKEGTPAEVENRIIQRMVALLTERAVPLPGVIESLEFFKAQGKKIGLATSSYEILIDTILQTLGIGHYFEQVHSAEREQYGKPHPAVYLTTAQQLGVLPQRCLVVEDSLNGIISAKAARMTVICVPEKSHTPEPKLMLADAQFDSLTDVVRYFKQQISSTC
ncbi:MAG TPA: hexitol phosphatase HxpB [Fluviicola sp.]|nr:hexitol phosphatase HxpB [Fluviicola sp.]